MIPLVALLPHQPSFPAPTHSAKRQQKQDRQAHRTVLGTKCLHKTVKILAAQAVAAVDMAALRAEAILVVDRAQRSAPTVLALR